MMAKHPNEVEGLTAEKLAEKFARTTYGFQLEFFKELYDLYSKERDLDWNRGYNQLGRNLNQMVNILGDAQYYMREIWEICEPKMEEVIGAVKSYPLHECKTCRFIFKEIEEIGEEGFGICVDEYNNWWATRWKEDKCLEWCSKESNE
jgi:hypothetical protein